jgi:hypothetical protein
MIQWLAEGLRILCNCCRRDADRVAGLLEANGIYNTKLLVNRVRPDMIQKNDMMSVRDVQVRTQRDVASAPRWFLAPLTAWT